MRSTASIPRAYLKHIFLTGNTPTTSLQSDPRFCYALYVPEHSYLPTATSPKIPLLVTVHGSRREYLATRDSLIPLADAPGTPCAILAPLFPAGITDSEDLGSYKRVVAITQGSLSESGSVVRYDRALLDMIDEVAFRYPGIETATFSLVGFSGGGQFVHRFLYLYPQRILAASIGAPGEVTLLEHGEWPRGTADVVAKFDRLTPVGLAVLQKVKLQIFVGEEDVQTEQFSIAKSLDSGRQDERPRVEKARELFENWRTYGLDAKFDLVPGVAHSRVGCHGTLVEFLTEQFGKRQG